MHYLIVIRDDRFWLVGPFHTAATAIAWGDDPANNPADDQRWQPVRLTAVPAGVEVRDPSAGPMEG